MYNDRVGWKCWFRKWRTLCDYFIMLIKIKNTVILLAFTAGDRFKRSRHQTLSEIHCVVHSANIVKAQRWLQIAIDIVKRWNGPLVEVSHCISRCELWTGLRLLKHGGVQRMCLRYISAYRTRTVPSVTSMIQLSFWFTVCLSVCLFVCLFVCAEFFSAVFDPISIKLGHMLYVWV